VVPCIYVQVSGFSCGSLWASNGQVEGIDECYEIIIRHLCGPRPHLVGMKPLGRSICQRSVVETAPIRLGTDPAIKSWDWR
jgi:hypothetical protein